MIDSFPRQQVSVFVSSTHFLSCIESRAMELFLRVIRSDNNPQELGEYKALKMFDIVSRLKYVSKISIFWKYSALTTLTLLIDIAESSVLLLTCESGQFQKKAKHQALKIQRLEKWRLSILLRILPSLSPAWMTTRSSKIWAWQRYTY